MSTHCVNMIKTSNLSLKIKKQEEVAIVSILDNVDSTCSNGEEDKPIKTFDWSSILSSSKNEDSSNKLNPTSPYVHPLDKRSTSCLSEKSLEICTESLGSETGSGSGSDCFPSLPTSEYDNHHHHQQQYSVVSEDFHVYNHRKISISSCRSFPPSLPCIHMQSRRQNGRLILEAAFIPPKNSLHAQRVDGHLLLTFINQNESKLEEFEQVFDDIQQEEDEGTMMEQSTRLSNMNKASMMILEKSNQLTWSKCTISLYFNSRYNNSINLMTEEEKGTSNINECYTYPSSVSQSLNAYQYFWRKKPNIVNNSTTTNYYNNKQVHGTDTKAASTTKIATCTQHLVLIGGKKASTMNNNLVPFLTSCKEPRRSLIIWEPYCIATS